MLIILGPIYNHSKYHAVLKGSQNNKVKHERLEVSSKLRHHRALKDISEALEQKLSSSKDISEAHRVF